MGAKSIGFVSALGYLSCFGNSPPGRYHCCLEQSSDFSPWGCPLRERVLARISVFLLFLGLFDFINN